MSTRLKFLFQRTYSSPEELLHKKFTIAEDLFSSWKDHFLKQEDFLNLLKEYEQAVLNSNSIMEKIKSFEECYICSVIDKKGCCKAGLENEVTINILLINMFLNKEIPLEREVSGRCFFVGPKGCKIFARPYLCREFFCKRLKEKFREEEYIKLTQAIAEELTLLYRLCEYIKREYQFLLGEFLFEMDITGYS
ncbi:hypothetical protein THC_1059 [Caldimicrobium thiodismutans]|jgi:hypothetical protein|uniref:Uncharacterized protein n=1 Tax=Caldimicrobium thiodismutans TaxID=1653476 RepID=A0A0U5B5S7_9BACT|nr:hypothetical protein [Caldimicrobium thiodismutans]BAU23440.1 hypothetical protein THC_1059 [Caldimicrobium thiodismutans]